MKTSLTHKSKKMKELNNGCLLICSTRFTALHLVETKAEKEVMLSQAKRKDHISLNVDIF